MNETTFSIASVAALFGWIALGCAVLSPPGRLRAALLTFGGRYVPGALCLLYAVVLALHWGSAPGGGFGNLAAVQALFAVPGKMLGGWVHFLAFDLLVARGVIDDVLAHGRARWPLLIVLPAMFMYGPLGLLLYVLLRSAFGAPSRALNGAA